MTVLANEQVIDGAAGVPALVERGADPGSSASRIIRRSCFRAGRADRLARQGAADAGELDRQVARPAIRFATVGAPERFRRDRGLYDPPRHADGRKLRRAVARSSADPGAGETVLKSPPSSRNAAASAPPRKAIETAEKLGFDTGSASAIRLTRTLGIAGLDREFRADGLRHRRDFRQPGP